MRQSEWTATGWLEVSEWMNGIHRRVSESRVIHVTFTRSLCVFGAMTARERRAPTVYKTVNKRWLCSLLATSSRCTTLGESVRYALSHTHTRLVVRFVIVERPSTPFANRKRETKPKTTKERLFGALPVTIAALRRQYVIHRRMVHNAIRSTKTKVFSNITFTASSVINNSFVVRFAYETNLNDFKVNW